MTDRSTRTALRRSGPGLWLALAGAALAVAAAWRILSLAALPARPGE